MNNRMAGFDLTRKWDRKIKGLAWHANMPYEEALQEAYILEWQAKEKIQDLAHRENYFLKCLKRKINSYGKTWWDTKRIASKCPELDIIDSLIQLRPHNELFYEYLVNDIKTILAEIDNIAAELFIIRITTKKRWNAIHKQYPQLAHVRFYNYIGDIKRVVKEEICKIL